MLKDTSINSTSICSYQLEHCLKSQKTRKCHCGKVIRTVLKWEPTKKEFVAQALSEAENSEKFYFTKCNVKFHNSQDWSHGEDKTWPM